MAAQPTAWLCSHPKSGRTWMRFALVQLLDSLHGLDGGFDMLNMFGLIPNSDGEGKTQPTKTPDNYRYSDRSDVPFIVMSHLPWESPFSELPAVFLVRSPGDVLVSYYHHMNRHDGRFQGTLDEFARDPEYGIPNIVAYLASWEPHLDDPNLTVATYERLKAEPVEEFGKLVSGLGIEAGTAELQAALDAASVERMRAVEARTGVGQPQAYDFEDPDARRVRKAKVGGWREEMDDDTIALLLAEIEASPEASQLLERLDLMPGPAPV